MILSNELKDISEIGGKAYNLLALKIKNTPSLFVCPASYFERLKTDKSVEKELLSDIEVLLSDRKKYAVRSSAIDEDSVNDSFAGVHDSFLNVDKKDVFKNIIKVYESAFTNRAASYRSTKGLSANDIKIAVVIQEMVDAEFAGVINTINPITNNPDEIVISVTRGLGDKLVDGSVSGTNYIINHGNVKCEGEDVLNKNIIKKIIRLADEVAKKTENFQDIEFAYSAGSVWFLQARAITTYKRINPHTRNLLIDNSNIVESFFGVTSPLTFTFAKDVYRDVYTGTLKCGKVRKKIFNSLKPYLDNMLYCYEGKIYYNMDSWYRISSVFPSKKSTHYFDNMIGVRSQSGYSTAKTNIFDKLHLGLVFFNKLKNIDKLADEFEKKFESIVMPHYGKSIEGSNAQLLDLALQIEKEIIGEFVVPIINDLAVMYYFGKLSDRAKKLKIAPDELNKYISNQGNVLSAGSANELNELIEAIKSDSEIFEDFKTLTPTELYKKYESGKSVSEKLNNYKLAYGSRVMDELKLETITMIEDKTLLYQIIKDNLSVERKTYKHESVTVPSKLKKHVNKVKKYIQIRERLRLKRTYVYSVVRNIFLAFGKNYKKDGRIENERDVFYLTKQEVISGKGDFLRIVEQRKSEEKENQAKPIYDRIVFFNGDPLPVKSKSITGGLHGIPSGSGTVQAKVSLMQSPTDKLKPGNIILTKRTDPGWISLFPMASGLIVEHGSMLSHSFVVARELNLPAVVGLENATALIPDGATVLLDGLSGEVKIIKT
ncbi:MAG: hypothetical protein J1G05_06340 [Clostridiales bacterium]|nr:hypothetical protein [Clostridiales bacterium]